MGLTDYISRNPYGAAKSISMYDEDFVIAQTDVIIQSINAIKQRGSPRELSNDYKAPNIKPEIKRQRGCSRKLTAIAG